jgi:prepilin-type processing-associated H-X9-DG protein
MDNGEYLGAFASRSTQIDHRDTYIGEDPPYYYENATDGGAALHSTPYWQIALPGQGYTARNTMSCPADSGHYNNWTWNNPTWGSKCDLVQEWFNVMFGTSFAGGENGAQEDELREILPLSYAGNFSLLAGIMGYKNVVGRQCWDRANAQTVSRFNDMGKFVLAADMGRGSHSFVRHEGSAGAYCMHPGVGDNMDGGLTWAESCRHSGGRAWTFLDGHAAWVQPMQDEIDKALNGWTWQITYHYLKEDLQFMPFGYIDDHLEEYRTKGNTALIMEKVHPASYGPPPVAKLCGGYTNTSRFFWGRGGPAPE